MHNKTYGETTKTVEERQERKMDCVDTHIPASHTWERGARSTIRRR